MRASLIDRLPFSRTARGSLLALLSTAAIASIFIVSKWALNSLDQATFSTWWYGATVIIAIAYQRVRGRPGLWESFRAQRPWPIMTLGLISGLSTVFFFSAIRLIDPAVASFFDRSETLFAILLGLWLFGERFAGLELRSRTLPGRCCSRASRQEAGPLAPSASQSSADCAPSGRAWY